MPGPSSSRFVKGFDAEQCRKGRTNVVVVVVVMLVVVVVVVDVVVVVVVVEVVVVEVVVVVVVLVVVVVVVVLHKFLFNERMNTQNRQRRAQCCGSFVNTNSSTRRDKQRGSKDPTLRNVWPCETSKHKGTETEAEQRCSTGPTRTLWSWSLSWSWSTLWWWWSW